MVTAQLHLGTNNTKIGFVKNILLIELIDGLDTYYC